MFHFPAYTPTQAMHSPAGNTTQLMLGFPIRTSSDQRLVGNSPRLNAASHVLHRPSMPRHPPYARNTKQHTTAASHTRTTTNCRHSTNNTTYRKTRCSRPLYSSHTTHTPHQQPPTSSHQWVGCHNNRNTQCCPRHPTACQHTQKRFPVTVQHLASHHTSTHIPGHTQTP